MKKIGIIGSGPVGKTLATGFLKYGYEVMIGSRDPSKLNDWKDKNIAGKTGTFNDVADFGQVLVLAVSGLVAEKALGEISSEFLRNKIMIDATNPISSDPPINNVLNFFTETNSSLMEKLQSKFPDVKFVKAFNSIGNAVMVDPNYAAGKPTMFICGNDAGAKGEVTGILDQFGWETEDMGLVEAARAIESLCILWCLPGFLRNQWTHAFKLLKK
jgi:predicted dinucleotide-binding enzyme